MRGIKSDSKVWTYAKDIGDAAGLDQPHVSKIIKRIRLTHPECLLDATMASIGETNPKYSKHKIILISPDGVPLFFNEIDEDRLLPDRKENVMRFRLFMISLVADTLSGVTEAATLQHIQEYMNDSDWKEIRSYTKQSNKVLMATLQESMEGKYGVGKVPRYIFMNENKMNNKFACGKHEKGIRDKMSSHELGVLYMSEHADTAYLLDGCTDYNERKLKLERVAAQYHKVLGGKTPNHLKGNQTSLMSYDNT